VAGFGGGSFTRVFDRLVLLGGPPGAPVELSMNVRASGRTFGDNFQANVVSFQWSVDGTGVASRTFQAPCDAYTERCFGSFDEAFSIAVTFTTGVSRLLETDVRTSGYSAFGGGYGVADYTRGFGSLPPGSFLVHCDSLNAVLGAGPRTPGGL